MDSGASRTSGMEETLHSAKLTMTNKAHLCEEEKKVTLVSDGIRIHVTFM